MYGIFNGKIMTPSTCGAREVGAKSRRLHHHLFLLVDANEIQWMRNLNKAEELWSRALGMYPVIPEGCVKRIWPTEPEEEEDKNINSNYKVFS